MMFRSVIPVLLLLIPLLLTVESSKIHACGPNLMDMLRTACPNGFNPLFSKRGSLGLFDYEDHLTDLDSSESHHMNSLSGIQRDFRGVVDDCCYQACSYTTLLSYCKS